MERTPRRPNPTSGYIFVAPGQPSGVRVAVLSIDSTTKGASKRLKGPDTHEAMRQLAAIASRLIY